MVEFELNKRLFFVSGILAAGTSTLFLFTLFAENSQSIFKMALIELILLLATAYFLAAYRGVKKIVVYEDRLMFLPNGFSLEFKDIERITQTSIDGHPHHIIEDVTLLMKSNREKWVPGYLLWNKKECSIKLIGEKSKTFNATFIQALDAYVEGQE